MLRSRLFRQLTMAFAASGVSCLHIRVMQKQAGEKEAATVTVDGVAQPGKAITLVDDGKEHAVEVMIA